MANTKVTKAVLADDAVGLAQLEISNDPSDGQALTAVAVSDGYNLTWANNTVAGISSSADATAITIDSSERVGVGTTSPTKGNLVVSGATYDSQLLIERTDTSSRWGLGGFTSGAFQIWDDNQSDASRFVINSSGHVGIGTTSPSSKLHVSVAGDPEVRLTNTSSSQTLRLDHNSMRTMTSSAISIMTNDNSSQQFRISAGGRMSLGANTGTSYSSNERVGIKDGVGNQTFGLGIQMGGTPLGLWHTSNSGTFIAFAYSGSGSASGSITFSSGTTSYGTGSDYRLKENVNYTWEATTRLKQLKPCRFNWIEDDTGTLVDGFLAHEVANVVPEAVVGEKDATYTAEEALENPKTEEGDAKIQMMDNSKLVPLLVKAIQELEARIETLESN